jgi:hypothetical protein
MLLEMNRASPLWSDEPALQQLFEHIPTIVMFTSTPPIWHIADTSPNEWMIIQSTIHPNKILHGNKKSSLSIKLTRKKYPLAMAALGRTIIPSHYEDVMNSSNAVTKLSLFFVMIGFVTMFMMQDRLFVPSSRIAPTILVDPDLLQSVSPSSSIELECFECLSHKGNGINDSYFNDSLFFNEFKIDKEIQEEENMMIPSTVSLVDEYTLHMEPSFVFMTNDATNSSIVEVAILPESMLKYDDNEKQMYYNNKTIPLSIIECEFDQIVLQLIQYRTEKMVQRVQQILQPISNMVQYRSLNMYNNLQHTVAFTMALEFINHWIKIIHTIQPNVAQSIVAMFILLRENLKTGFKESKQLHTKLKGNDMIQTWRRTLISIVTSRFTILNSYAQILQQAIHDWFQQILVIKMKESLLLVKSHIVFTIKKAQHNTHRITNRFIKNMDQCMINCEKKSFNI